MDYRSLRRRELEALAADLGQSAFRGRQIFRWLWTPGVRDFAQMTDIPKALRAELAEKGEISGLRLAARRQSEDGTLKFAWTLSDGLMVESVLIPEAEHTTLCLSSQVGCAMGCTFCQTARMGFHRQLEPSEIAGQVLAVIGEVPEADRPRNLVFMGMGEPLANADNVLAALDILTDDLGLNFSRRRITVSTCGLVPQMQRFGETADVGLAISLHAADDETRSRIMPVNRRYPLAELMAACRAYPLAPRRRITFEYLLLAGVNDAPEHARRLVKLLRGLPAKVNLIAFNESPGLAYKRPSEANVLAFQKVLTDAHYTAIIRKSKGMDIAAACGQLYAELQERGAKESAGQG